MREILGRLSFLCSRPILISILQTFLCKLFTTPICLKALMLSRTQPYPMPPPSRHLASLLVTCPARAAMRACLPPLTCIRTLLTRLLTRPRSGCILTTGLNSFAGWTIRLIMTFLDPTSLQLVGAVSMQTIRPVTLLNLLNPSGWPLTVVGRWNLHLIRPTPWVWLFLHTVCTRGMSMRSLLTITRKLLGKKLSR